MLLTVLSTRKKNIDWIVIAKKKKKSHDNLKIESEKLNDMNIENDDNEQQNFFRRKKKQNSEQASEKEKNCQRETMIYVRFDCVPTYN